MGKLKRSSLIKKNQKKSKSSSSQSGSSKLVATIEQLLDNAEECMDQYELERAYEYVKRALDLDAKHIESLNMMASIQMEMGNCDSAKTLYQKLVELKPNQGFSKYMCLAQLSSGQEAVDYYKKGIELILVEYNQQEQTNGAAKSSNVDDDDEEDGAKIRRIDISTAYCSLAELYLTDLCMEDTADSLCKSYLDKSIEYEARNPEALQLLASYWLSKEDIDEAKKCILASVDTWMPKYLEASENGPLVDPSQAIALTYDARINTARILTEVHEYEKASDVLEQLLDEDDEVVVIWYMLGWVNHLKGSDYFSNAKFYLKKADELGTKLNYQQRYLDEELKNHVKQLLNELANVPSDDEIDDDEEDKENLGVKIDEEYETDEDDDEENNGHEDGNKMDIV